MPMVTVRPPRPGTASSSRPRPNSVCLRVPSRSATAGSAPSVPTSPRAVALITSPPSDNKPTRISTLSARPASVPNHHDSRPCSASSAVPCSTEKDACSVLSMGDGTSTAVDLVASVVDLTPISDKTMFTAVTKVGNLAISRHKNQADTHMDELDGVVSVLSNLANQAAGCPYSETPDCKPGSVRQTLDCVEVMTRKFSQHLGNPPLKDQYLTVALPAVAAAVGSQLRAAHAQRIKHIDEIDELKQAMQSQDIYLSKLAGEYERQALCVRVHSQLFKQEQGAAEEDIQVLEHQFEEVIRTKVARQKEFDNSTKCTLESLTARVFELNTLKAQLSSNLHQIKHDMANCEEKTRWTSARARQREFEANDAEKSAGQLPTVVEKMARRHSEFGALQEEVALFKAGLQMQRKKKRCSVL